MGASVSSNYAEQAQSASQSFSTKVGQAMKSSQSAVNSAVQTCHNMTITAKNSDVSACQQEVEQGISAKQVNEAFQKASIENQSYSAMQQKMSQAAKAPGKASTWGLLVRVQHGKAEHASLGRGVQRSEPGVRVRQRRRQQGDADLRWHQSEADGSKVQVCNQAAAQKQLINQISKCRQDTAVKNKASRT